MRPELPSECPEMLASLISSCWDADPTHRPIFSDICRELQEIFLKQQEEEAQKDEEAQKVEEAQTEEVQREGEAQQEEGQHEEEAKQELLEEDSGLFEESIESRFTVLGGAESRGPGSFSFGVSEKLNNLPSTSDEYTGQGTEVAPGSDDLAKSLWVIPEKSFGFFPTRSSCSKEEVVRRNDPSSTARTDRSAVESSRVHENKSWPYFDPDFDTTSTFYPPKVTIENATNASATVVKVDSDNRHGILLNVVQLFTDLELTIKKCDIFSDGGWFFDVFHVVDRNGFEVRDDETLRYIDKSLSYSTKREQSSANLLRRSAVLTLADHTVIEATGPDRPGLLAEVSAVLSEFDCNMNGVELWTHNLRVASIIYCTERGTGLPIESQAWKKLIKKLSCVMNGYHRNEVSRCKIKFATIEITNVDRRLHQLMHADRGHQELAESSRNRVSRRFNIQISKNDYGYSVISIQGKDRPKLLFDIVCTLTDMQYAIHHASISSSGPDMTSEFYIRHINGCTLSVVDERHLEECLEAAIDRRTSEGSKLKLCVRRPSRSLVRRDSNISGDRCFNCPCKRDHTR